MYSIIEMQLYGIMEAMMYFRTPKDHVVREGSRIPFTYTRRSHVMVLPPKGMVTSS